MCGIAAHFNFRGPATPLNLQLIAHRGPDAAGEWISADRRFWLGNTRLAILDLSPTGAQPMVDPATGNVIVVNGEIYNHRALRTELGDADWRGTSDTETLVAGLCALGAPVARSAQGNVRLRHLRSCAPGAFRRARSVWHQATLLRGGCRRFPFRLRGKGSRWPSSTITPAAIGAYLQWGACPEDQLLYSGIHVLPAGHAMTIGVGGARLSSREEVSCAASNHPGLDRVSPHRPSLATGLTERDSSLPAKPRRKKSARSSRRRSKNIFSPMSRSPVSSAAESTRRS